MRVVGAVSWGGVVLLAAASGCATGTLGSGDDVVTDAGVPHDGAAPVDAKTPPKDSGGGGTDASSGGNDAAPDTGACGGTCTGTNQACCSNACVDTSSDGNNCGSCGTACGAQTCCSSACVDTMGSDDANCGGCGVTCSGTCTNGVCNTNTTCTVDKAKCAHSPCVIGAALGKLCDLTDEGLVFTVCLTQASCCSTSWDASCVLAASLLETNSCGGC